MCRVVGNHNRRIKVFKGNQQSLLGLNDLFFGHPIDQNLQVNHNFSRPKVEHEAFVHFELHTRIANEDLAFEVLVLLR